MKFNEIIIPCICSKDVDGDNGMYTGMPVFTPTRKDTLDDFPIYWNMECPKCGRFGIGQYKTVQAGIKDWNEHQKSLWEFEDGLNLPWAYPVDEEDTYEPLYERYHAVIKEIGYGYLLGMSAEEKKPLYERMGLQEKVELLEGVLRRKQTEEAERKRMWGEE